MYTLFIYSHCIVLNRSENFGIRHMYWGVVPMNIWRQEQNFDFERFDVSNVKSTCSSFRIEAYHSDLIVI
jgi:hypothetical protein